MNEKDIYRAAQACIGAYGELADLFAAGRADDLLAAGDMEGRRTWLRIIEAIDELQRKERSSGEAVQ